MIIDPAAPRGLEQRMIQEERETATRPQDPSHLGNGGFERVDVFEDQAGHNSIKAVAGMW